MECHTYSSTEVNIFHKIVNKNIKNIAVMQPRPMTGEIIIISISVPKIGDDRMSFNVICDMCDV